MTATQGTPWVIRPLGHSERYFQACLLMKMYVAELVMVRYRIPSDLPPETDLQRHFLHALGRTVMRHPLMQVGLGGEQRRKPWFVRLASMDLDAQCRWQVVAEDYARTAEDAYKEEIETQFADPETRPGWRVHVLAPKGGHILDVMFAIRHTMGDGMSAKIFHSTLLEELASFTPCEHLDGKTLTFPDRGLGIYPPPLHVLAPVTISMGYLVPRVWEEFRPSFLNKPNYVQRRLGKHKPGPPKTLRKAVMLSKGMTDKVLAACRARKVTLTALLNGIMFAALLREANGEKDGGVSPMCASTPVDMRRWIADRYDRNEFDPHSTFANMVTIVEHEFAVSRAMVKKAMEGDNGVDHTHLEEIVWEVAGMAKGDIDQRLEWKLHDDLSGLQHLVGDWRKEVTRGYKHPRRECWQLTNLGVMDVPGKGGWGVDRAMFTCSSEVLGPVFIWGIMSAKGGELVLDLSVQDGLGEVVEGIRERLPGEMGAWLGYIATGNWVECESKSAFEL